MSSATTHPPPGGNVGRGHVLTITSAVTGVVAVIAVLLRAVTRARILKATGWDDWCLFFALTFTIISIGTESAAVHAGLGHHTFYLTPNQRVTSSRLSDVGQVFCIMSLTMTKVSVAILFARVTNGTNLPRKWLAAVYLWVNAGAAFIVNILTIAIMFGQCTPVEKNFNPKVAGHCWNIKIFLRFVLAQGVTSAITDFTLSAYPFIILRKLNMPTRTKASVIGLMSLGFIAGVLAIVRSIYSAKNSKVGDGPWTSIYPLTWATVERNVAIILVSIPPLPKLLPPLTSATKHMLAYLRPRSNSTTHPEAHGYRRQPSKKQLNTPSIV